MLSKLGGVEQLAPEQERLATTFVGNWGISGAVRALGGSAFQGAADEGADGDLVEGGADPRLRSLREGPGRQQLCSRLSSRPLMQLRCKGTTPAVIPLRRCPDGEALESAWAQLKAHFGADGTCLLLHQKNHYSLIYAMREWVEAGTDDAAADAKEPEPTRGRRARQVLTARKGQRPSAWVDWAEVHQFLAGWSGYAIMQVSAPEHEA